MVKNTCWEESGGDIFGPIGTMLQEVPGEVCRGCESDAPLEELEGIHFHDLEFCPAVRARIGARLSSMQ